MENRPGWGGGKPNAASLLLDGLGDDTCDELIANLLGGAHLPDSLAGRIREAAEGTPLFVEQFVGMLIDDGELVLKGDEYRAVRDLSALPVPPTITALLTARVDRLGVEERQVLQHASVIGKEFAVDQLEALVPDPLRAGLWGHLTSLDQAGAGTRRRFEPGRRRVRVPAPPDPRRRLRQPAQAGPGRAAPALR